MNCPNCDGTRAVSFGNGFKCTRCGELLPDAGGIQEIVTFKQPPLGTVGRMTRRDRKNTVYTESQAWDMADDTKKQGLRNIREAAEKNPLREAYYNDVVAAPVGENIT